MKKVSKKFIIVGVVLVVPIVAIIIFGLWFYFAPAPQAVKDIAKNRELERCIYSGGIGYFTSVVTPDDFHYFYNSQGETLCYTGGIAGRKAEGACETKNCFPIYGPQ